MGDCGLIIKNLKPFDKMLLTIALLSLVCCILSGCSYVNKKMGLKDDNVAEELIEDIIQIKTGASIDLSPDTPENQPL